MTMTTRIPVLAMAMAMALLLSSEASPSSAV